METTHALRQGRYNPLSSYPHLLRVDVTSRDVADLACAMAGPLFANTTASQVPIDGGNERVV